MNYRSFPNKEEFLYQVSIDNYVEWQKHWEISAWCREQFGESTHMVKWRHSLSGSPSRAHPEFSTWLFMDESDATIFRMRWG